MRGLQCLEIVAYAIDAQVLWILAFIASTLYIYWWDVNMDWGLGWKEHGYLRKHLMFKRKAYYYGAIVIDFVLRFLWMYQLVPIEYLPNLFGPSSSYFNYYVLPFVAIAELCRRFMWAILRYVPPIHTRSQVLFRVPVSYLCRSYLLRRRCHGALFAVGRVENEHLSNAFGHRQTDYVPLHFDVPQPEKLPRTPLRVLLEALGFIVFVVVVSVVAALSPKN